MLLFRYEFSYLNNSMWCVKDLRNSFTYLMWMGVCVAVSYFEIYHSQCFYCLYHPALLSCFLHFSACFSVLCLISLCNKFPCSLFMSCGTSETSRLKEKFALLLLWPEYKQGVFYVLIHLWKARIERSDDHRCGEKRIILAGGVEEMDDGGTDFSLFLAQSQPVTTPPSLLNIHCFLHSPSSH